MLEFGGLNISHGKEAEQYLKAPISYILYVNLFSKRKDCTTANAWSIVTDNVVIYIVACLTV
jgi:hypothetical protein